MDECGFIPDGQVRKGYVARKPGVHPAVHFEYRPTMPVERAGFNQTQANLYKTDAPKDAETAQKNMAKFLAKKLISWDLRDGSKNVVAISEATLLGGVENNLFADLYAIVMGYRPSDVDPAAPEEKPADEGAELGNSVAGCG